MTRKHNSTPVDYTMALSPRAREHEHDGSQCSEEITSSDPEGTSTDHLSTLSSERDEILEVRKAAGADNRKVAVWRTIATIVLLLTAVAVTLTTYYFLQRQQTDSFETQFKQFSRTVADEALSHQKQSKLAHRGLADFMTTYAEETNATWPYFVMPKFETLATNVMEQSRTEVMGFSPLVPRGSRQQYLDFVNDTYKDFVAEAHMIRFGNLDHLYPLHYKPYMSKETAEGLAKDEVEYDFDVPILQWAPAPFSYGLINVNGSPSPYYGPLSDAMVELHTESVITPVKPYTSAVGVSLSQEDHGALHENVFLENSDTENPHSFMATPVYERINDPDAPIVALLGISFAWDVFMIGLLPKGVNGISVVLENNCDQVYTYEINGPTVTYKGEGDKHDTDFDYMETFQDLWEGLHSNPRFDEVKGHCRYAIRIYPTTKFEDSLDPHVPKVFAAVVAATFILVAAVFWTYDLFVYRRNEMLIANNAQSNAIVSSLFPSNIRDKLINPSQDRKLGMNPGASLKNFMLDGDSKPGVNNKPLADLFLTSTVLFADVSGFTAWSSVREPTQVFTLLETLYGAFDHIAKIRKVFKVETVSDCYVAATGIPEYRRDHAILMVRFARDILARMSTLTKELETTLGPDTGDLALRIGIHSGPVTAGVLRGERARFQLFGDTMNVCSRMEGTCVAGRIQISGETAECLRRGGKTHWLVRRKELVEVKGKGEVQTFWIGVGVEQGRAKTAATTVTVFEPSGQDRANDSHDARISRLVDWNVEMLSQILVQIVTRRQAQQSLHGIVHAARSLSTRKSASGSAKMAQPLEEVEEIIHLPEFDAKVAQLQEDMDPVCLPRVVTDQLRKFVATIASLYQENPFHNFEHASHVTMSVVKLLSRIVAPVELMEAEEEMPINGRSRSFDATLHDHTYGITSDPLTQFSCAFAAMIHDVDHPGVPNAQLVKEGIPLADQYKSRSVAEQNSVVLAWDMLLSEEYQDLRSALCHDKAELDRFRKLVVNTVMATDIVDKDLKALRNGRWDKAFHIEEKAEPPRMANNRKATIVIEHLIQASDVAHTMQHWHVYRKWNEKFFRECHAAYLDGRAEKDPTEGWYKGEIGFFDFYIIPLAKKLKDCGVFGKSSDEYLNYAVANRNEWEKRGESVVAEMIATLPKK